MSRAWIKIEGSEIRARLRADNLPGGVEKKCCGGKVSYSKDYETQLKRLNMHGAFQVLERGCLMAQIIIP